VCTNFFSFNPEFDSGIMFKRRPPVKMVDFHGEVTFISVFDGSYIYKDYLFLREGLPIKTLSLDIDIYVFAYYRRSRYLFVSCLNDLSQ
jgi:hypothetical protein